MQVAVHSAGAPTTNSQGLKAHSFLTQSTRQQCQCGGAKACCPHASGRASVRGCSAGRPLQAKEKQIRNGAQLPTEIWGARGAAESKSTRRLQRVALSACACPGAPAAGGGTHASEKQTPAAMALAGDAGCQPPTNRMSTITRHKARGRQHHREPILLMRARNACSKRPVALTL
jgi:hypothetical protein